jgi:hypothetical protein
MFSTVKLLPNTKRLKQVIKEHGHVWNLLQGPMPMQCFDNELGILIKSLDDKHVRNVRVTDVLREWEE